MLSKKSLKKYKNDIIVLSVLGGIILIIIIIIIILNVTRKKRIESFNNYKYYKLNNYFARYFKGTRKPLNQITTKQSVYNDKLSNVYIIEQIRNKYDNMDDYTIKSSMGDVLFNTEGRWDLHDSKFQLVSTGGQAISVQESGSSRYFFSIGNINISFYYKKIKIFGKIIIDDGDNLITIYMKQNKQFTNFYTDTNDRVAYTKLETIYDKDNNKKIINKLTITEKYNKYYNIFIIVFIVYLQIYKYQNSNDNFL